LTVTFYKVMRVSTSTDVSPTSYIDQSAMYFGHGRGCGRGRGATLTDNIVHLAQDTIFQVDD